MFAVCSRFSVDPRRMIEQAKSTASKAQNEVEHRAKKAGVPLDDYKKRAEPVIGDVQREVVGSASYFDTKQEEVKKQGTSEQTQYTQPYASLIAVVKESVSGNTSSGGGKSDTSKDTKSTSKSKSKSNGKADNKPKKTAGLMDNVPQTPLGGHDPTANNAPSFAKAAEAAAAGTDSKSEGLMDDVPQTPLGGHDPTASNAPSYAQAANE